MSVKHRHTAALAAMAFVVGIELVCLLAQREHTQTVERQRDEAIDGWGSCIGHCCLPASPPGALRDDESAPAGIPHCYRDGNHVLHCRGNRLSF